MTLQIEEGKYYINRIGDKVGPMTKNGISHLQSGKNEEVYVWTVDNEPTFTDQGRMGYDTSIDHELDLVAEWVDEPAKEALDLLTPPAEPDVRQHIIDTAGKIVNGDRRGAYGTPEMNFGRIAAFWNVYFANTGRDVTLTAADVSPMMRLMKEARLCENPGHLDSLIDIVGYTLTGAEVNNVKISK